MTKIDEVYEYLTGIYKPDEPIFLSEISIPDMDAAVMRQQLKKLTLDGRIKRFDTGIYFIPRKSIFKSGSTLSLDAVIRKKYLMNGTERCGYMSGMWFANQLGLTTQVSAVYEIYTNKATKDYRETNVANIKVILRKPYVKVDDQNVSVLQFLDLLKEVTIVSEIEGEELTLALVRYMKKKEIKFDDLRRFLPYYPEKIYKNMYEAGLLNGISA
ncbi:hypothetical protein [Ruminococcus sp. HUN007]|uniref:hypothetical protein n=1 Tax=Ruminococcus sp. HUN007 TaxID=1514668 RepID=UPI0005D142F5|nr:hypothetical protein [Ruminococcus sp. HUN007]